MRPSKESSWKVIEAKSLLVPQKAFIQSIWNKEYPVSLRLKTEKDFDQYLATLQNPTHFFWQDNGQFIAWSVVFERENETWFAMILDRKFQGIGLGTNILKHIQDKFKTLNGWVVREDKSYKKADGTSYQTPIRFYAKNGFSLVHDSILSTENIEAIKMRWSNDTIIQ